MKIDRASAMLRTKLYRRLLQDRVLFELVVRNDYEKFRFQKSRLTYDFELFSAIIELTYIEVTTNDIFKVIIIVESL